MKKWDLHNRQVEIWAWAECFSKEECNKIIDTFSKDTITAWIGKGEDLKVRNSDINWIDPDDPDNYWIYQRCTDVVNRMNPEFFGFDLAHLEDLQFTVYDSAKGNQHYGKHLDMMGTGPSVTRKLSFSILLSDPNDFDGGDLKLYAGNTPAVVTKKQGNCSLFPSYLLHEVTPTTKGIRYALVGWSHGSKPFR
jgi:PKHD-type hydroxylase